MPTNPKAEISRLETERYRSRLKKTILYKGPDPVRQEAAVYWLARALGYWVHGPHRQIIRHQNLTAFGQRQSDLTLGFRGLGKSTVGNIVRCVKYIIDNPNVRILIGSDTGDAAEKFLREVRSHLQFNEDLRAMFGTFLSTDRYSDLGRYRDSYMTIRQRADRTISEPTITTLGIGSQAAGGHYDVILLDDLVTIRNSRTPTQKKNVNDWHGSTLLGCTMPHTVVHYLGTRYFPHALYQDLSERRVAETQGVLGECTLKIPALLHRGTDDERSNEPERYSLEYLLKMEKRMGRYHFASQMQQDTSAGEGLVFRYNDFRWYGGEGVDDRPTNDKLGIFQFSDLTGRKTDTGAFYVSVTIGVTMDTEPGQRRVYVLDIARKRCGMRDQRQSILQQINLWNPIQHGIEAVQMQAGFAEEVGEVYDRRAIPVEVETDKVFRARRVAPVVEAERVFFPYPDSPLGRRMAPLVDELCAFPDSEYVDCVDAFVGAITLALFSGPPAASGSSEDEASDWQDGDGLRGNY